jgi:hypothetical protein
VRAAPRRGRMFVPGAGCSVLQEAAAVPSSSLALLRGCPASERVLGGPSAATAPSASSASSAAALPSRATLDVMSTGLGGAISA